MRRIALLAVLLLCPAMYARAQASIYIESSNIRLSDVPGGSISSPSGPTQQYDTYWASGIGGGVTVNILPLPIVSLGVDLRGSTKSGNNGADTAMVGLKLGVHPPVLPIKPYVQFSTGYLATRTPGGSGTITNKYLAYEVFGGIDYPLMHFVDFRVIEIGGGGVVDSGSSNSPTLFNVNTGLVLHF
ncbi:MAG TPA: hypothetical protein VG714_07655 [Acidobacteriaceae bacterium]|nr:hypothetical protein [Acidobacteriaceae bacterium]